MLQLPGSPQVCPRLDGLNDRAASTPCFGRESRLHGCFQFPSLGHRPRRLVPPRFSGRRMRRKRSRPEGAVGLNSRSRVLAPSGALQAGPSSERQSFGADMRRLRLPKVACARPSGVKVEGDGVLPSLRCSFRGKQVVADLVSRMGVQTQGVGPRPG